MFKFGCEAGFAFFLNKSGGFNVSNFDFSERTFAHSWSRLKMQKKC